MKFVKETTANGIQIPTAALKLSGFAGGEGAELHTFQDVMVILKGRMTAMELLNAAKALQSLSVALHTHLAKVCGKCCDCCGEGGCPAEFREDEGIVLPADLREEAGIPQDAKLQVYVDEEANTVTIMEADYDHDLRDVPPEVLEMFQAAGVCLDTLEDLIQQEEIVYGG